MPVASSAVLIRSSARTCPRASTRASAPARARARARALVRARSACGDGQPRTARHELKAPPIAQQLREDEAARCELARLGRAALAVR